MSYSSLGSAVHRLGHFLVTKLEDHMILELGGFIMLTLGCWFHCKYTPTKKNPEKELPDKDSKARFSMKVHTLILEEHTPRATATAQS
ncbi:hypothetical protein LEMLEM_LOCUS8046 [Lemmus lemmus]